MPEPVHTLIDQLERHARDRPHKPFLVHARGETFRVVSYSDLAEASRTWAARLHAALGEAPSPGPDEREVVAIVLEAGPDLYAAVLGALRSGRLPTVLAPPSPKQSAELHWAAHRALFDRVRPVAAITFPEHAQALAPLTGEYGAALVTRASPAGAAPPDASLDAHEPALLQHSSGTTGLKKGVMLNHADILNHTDMLGRALGFGADDVVASWLPLYHDMGLVTGFLLPLVAGASVVAVDPFEWVADPAVLLRLVERHRATFTWSPNFALAHLARTRDPNRRYDLTSLRAVIDCSEPCRPETMDAFLAAFADCGLAPDRMAACYGMAEVVFAANQTAPGRPPRTLALDAERLERDGAVVAAQDATARLRRLLSCGPPLAGVDLRIAGAEPGRAQVGEILLKSRTLFAGHHRAPELDATAFDDGWLRSGDLGFVHEGELFVCGRTKELIIVHGRNLHASDVEAAAGAVPGVKPGRVAALGLWDEAAGTEECALLIETEAEDLSAAGAAALKRAVRERVAAELDLHVRRIEVGPAGWLVKSTSGKVSRALNRERLEALKAPEAEPAVEPAPAELAEVMDALFGPPAPEPPPPPDDPRADAPPTLREALALAVEHCFGLPAAAVGDDLGPGDVDGWDSLGHTVLMLRLEKLTGLSIGERVACARSVGAITRALELHLEDRRAA